MDSIHIRGGVPLQGKVRVQGSKNAALPILAASILTKDTSWIRNCPRIADVYQMIRILKSLGCDVSRDGDGIRIRSGAVCQGEMPVEAITGMRSSLCLLGALLGKCGEVVMEYPGGCVIGDRPIDLHISALSQMGVEFEEKGTRLRAVAPRLCGAHIVLPFASVGATENIILAAVMAEGETVIEGAACEPEIIALCAFLKKCGASIEGEGSSRIRICGRKPLTGTMYRVPADRIVAGTYLFGCMITGGNVFLEEADASEMEAVLHFAESLGSKCVLAENGIYVQALKRPVLPARLITAPYPGFPTDMQSMALAVMAVGEGACLVEENIFENRFRVVKPLQEMGADITELDCRRVIVRGVEKLFGRNVEARELRGGAALVLAGLAAEGNTQIRGCGYIYRGYENITKDLRELGARINGE